MPTQLDLATAPPTRQAALRFLFGRIDYERIVSVPYGVRAFKLQRMHELLERLDNPHRSLPIVHVAGTKGKGSTAAMIGAVLVAAGYRTGLFTSPHLNRIEERMAVDGEPCSAGEFVELVDYLRPAVEAMDAAAERSGDVSVSPTFFEITTAMALLQFARRHVDAAVLEVGLGGRLDSTNACTPRVSVITSISFDHTRQLGNTLAAIAREKAGIIKPAVPVVSGVTQPEARHVIRQVCRQHDCRLTELGADFDYDYEPPRHLERAAAGGRLSFRHRDKKASTGHDDLHLALLGRHQAANASVALAALAELTRIGWTIPRQAVHDGLAEVRFPARCELLARRPAVILDGAHNGASVDALLDVLAESFTPRRRLLVFAATQEKDAQGMLSRLVDQFDEVILTRYVENPRAVPPEQLAALLAKSSRLPREISPSPADAWDRAVARAGPDDLICVTGSLFLAAEIRQLILRTKGIGD